MSPKNSSKMEEEEKEIAAEQAATQTPKEDEIRAKIVEEMGFDPETDSERIDKLVAKELDHHKKLSTTIGQKIKYRELAKKAPKEAPEIKSEVLSTKDVFALSKANIHEDDLDWLVRQAKASETTVTEVLKDDEVKAILKLRTEKRNTADAANTKPARPGSRKPDGATLAKELSSEGKVPEPGSDEAEELFWARRGGKRK